MKKRLSLECNERNTQKPPRIYFTRWNFFEPQLNDDFFKTCVTVDTETTWATFWFGLSKKIMWLFGGKEKPWEGVMQEILLAAQEEIKEILRIKETYDKQIYIEGSMLKDQLMAEFYYACDLEGRIGNLIQAIIDKHILARNEAVKISLLSDEIDSWSERGDLDFASGEKLSRKYVVTKENKHFVFQVIFFTYFEVED